MTSHAAIRDSVIEMSRRIGRYNIDVPEMKSFMEYVERSQPGDEFTNTVRNILAPIAQYITVRNIDEISQKYKDFPVKLIIDKVPVAEQDALWQALGMTNMLLTTIQMVPPEMLNKIEAMTNTMMGAMKSGGFNDIFKNMGSMVGSMPNFENEDDSGDDVSRVRPKTAVSKQQEFRDKLC